MKRVCAQELYQFVRSLDSLAETYYDPSVGRFTTVLHYAVSHNDVKTTRYLLKRMRVNYIDQYGRTPLHYASSQEMIELLLSCGANPYQRDFSMTTPMMQTSQSKPLLLYLYARNGFRIPQYIKTHQNLSFIHFGRVKCIIIPLLAMKRRRVSKMLEFDRFLIRELALMIYSCR